MRLLVTFLIAVLCWAIAILAFGDFVLWIMAASTALLVVIAVVASVESWLRRRYPNFENHGRKRVGLR